MGRRLVVFAAIVALLVTACDAGRVTGVAGTGGSGRSGDGGPATSATFEQPGGLLAIPGGGFYVVDQGACVIRKVDAAGTITTVAGTGTCGYSGDGGPATSARIRPGSVMFPAPAGQLALDDAGNLYLADSDNFVVRRIAVDGTITTLAGPGSITTEGAGSFSTCSGTSAAAGGVAVTPDGTVYVACPQGIGKLLGDGTLQQIYSGNPVALASDAAGDLYFSTYENGRVWKRDAAGTVTLFADVESILGSAYSEITGLTVGPDGSVYGSLGPIEEIGPGGSTFIPVSGNRVIRIGSGTATVIGGTGVADPGSLQSGYGPQLDLTPYGIAVTSSGNLLVSSGRAVYRLNDAATATSWSGTDCDPAIYHPVPTSPVGTCRARTSPTATSAASTSQVRT